MYTFEYQPGVDRVTVTGPAIGPTSLTTTSKMSHFLDDLISQATMPFPDNHPNAKGRYRPCEKEIGSAICGEPPYLHNQLRADYVGHAYE